MDKKSVLIVVLLFFVILSGGGLYFLMKQNSDLTSKFEAYQNIVVANKNIEVGQKINQDDIAIISLQKKSIPFKVLVAKEVVGKFATVPIYKDEPFRAEKISPPEEFLKKEEEILSLEYIPKNDIFNMNLAQFRNPNYLLKKNDNIDIIAVTTINGELVAKIVSPNTKILGFVRKGFEQNRAVETTTPKATAKEPNPAPIVNYADEILLDIREDEIKKIVDATNNGNQFWMIWDHNSKKIALDKIQDENQGVKLKLEENLSLQTESKKTTPKTKLIPRYKNRATIIMQEATISFETKEGVKKYETLSYKDPLGCTKFIEVTSRYANIREIASLDSKIISQARSKDVIGYIEKMGSFYKLCDGKFIHQSIAREVR